VQVRDSFEGTDFQVDTFQFCTDIVIVNVFIDTKKQKMLKQTLIFFLLVYSSLSMCAQGLLQDTTFFERETQTYQAWLDNTNLGKVLQVYDIGISEKELSLYLVFNTEDSEQCWAQWEQLQLDSKQQKAIGLPQQLFYELITIMDVRQSIANIQIYDTYDLSQEPCFVVGIYFEDGGVKVIEEGCKSKKADITIPPTQIEGKEASEQEFYKVLSRAFVFDSILSYSIQRYETQRYEDRPPKVVKLENGDVLRFRAEDLALEVLTDERQGWERYIGQDWIKRERLTITVTYKRTLGGLKLGVDVDGKYGSGFFSDVGRDGYHLMDDDFEEYLEDYANTLILEYARLIK